MESLTEVKEKLTKVLDGYDGFWALAGGWAIDFFLNQKTREHNDIEIATWRDEQSELQGFLSAWKCDYYQKGVAFHWTEQQTLELPVHELHCRQNGNKLEILLNERQGNEWIFRRNPRITYPEEKFSLESIQGIRILSPEVVLLYKSKSPNQNDDTDLKNALKKMETDQIKWVQENIKTLYSDHRWLQVLDE